MERVVSIDAGNPPLGLPPLSGDGMMDDTQRLQDIIDSAYLIGAAADADLMIIEIPAGEYAVSPSTISNELEDEFDYGDDLEDDEYEDEYDCYDEDDEEDNYDEAYDDEWEENDDYE